MANQVMRRTNMALSSVQLISSIKQPMSTILVLMLQIQLKIILDINKMYILVSIVILNTYLTQADT